MSVYGRDKEQIRYEEADMGLYDTKVRKGWAK